MLRTSRSLTFLALSATLLLVACNQTTAGDLETPPLAIEVTTTAGKVQGTITDAGLKVWQGIPYAAPPIGDLRWQPPQPAIAWDGVLDASEPGPICIQDPDPPGTFYAQPPQPMNEDCLTLNIWSGAEIAGEARPVMFWIHGGALVNGSGDFYPGDTLAGKGVVLVTINYRLNAFGFMAHPELTAESSDGVSGNQGLLDQIAALRWVRDNIANFGGDPNNVTIFGESAGSASVSLVQASPLAKGLFHRAIGQSGGVFQPMVRLSESTAHAKSAETVGQEFAEGPAHRHGRSIARRDAWRTGGFGARRIRRILELRNPTDCRRPSHSARGRNDLRKRRAV